MEIGLNKMFETGARHLAARWRVCITTQMFGDTAVLGTSVSEIA